MLCTVYLEPAVEFIVKFWLIPPEPAILNTIISVPSTFTVPYPENEAVPSVNTPTGLSPRRLSSRFDKVSELSFIYTPVPFSPTVITEFVPFTPELFEYIPTPPFDKLTSIFPPDTSISAIPVVPDSAF